jgi:lysyl-tRNA synthetase class 2
MLHAARAFFASRNVLEVDTPALSPSAVSDPNIESVPAALRLDNGVHRYLHTSPEYCMKRLLCAGYPDIYSICKVFRDSESGRRHQPEFTLAEWYRIGFGLQDMIGETCEFLAGIIDREHLRGAPVSRSYSQAFAEFAELDALAADCDALSLAVNADDRLRHAVGDDRDAWLDLAMSRRIAPRFAQDRLTVIHHYPASQAALARICPDNPLVADRFEIFLGEVELANGYVELLDPAVLLQRWQTDQETRQRKQQSLLPLDAKLVAAMQEGMPPCAGVAVGFDRLLMINENIDDIRRVQTFPFERAEKS